MYAPLLQSSSTNAITTLQCVYLIVAIIIAAIVLVNLASKTKNAPPYSRAVTTTLPREEVVKLVEHSFPKSIVISSFNWKSSWETPERMAIAGYYVTNGQGCLVMILTGIIPGALLIWLAMGRTEKVIVDFAKFQGTGKLTLEAKGLRARREVDTLAPKLGIPGTPNEQASPTDVATTQPQTSSLLMENQASAEVERLLHDLHDVGLSDVRKAAAEQLGRMGKRDERVFTALQTAAQSDMSENVRRAAKEALQSLGTKP